MAETNGESIEDLGKLMALRDLETVRGPQTIIHEDDPSRMTCYWRDQRTGEPQSIELHYPNINLFHDV